MFVPPDITLGLSQSVSSFQMRWVKRQGRFGRQTCIAGEVQAKKSLGQVAIQGDEARDGLRGGSAIGLGDGETDPVSVEVGSGLVLGREGGG
jgi:hypothetical protein